jgi:hypothetical protein
LPSRSPSTWISTWRGRAIAFSRYTVSSPKNFLASLRARSQALAISPAAATRRIPLPPPPEAALSMTGKPIFVRGRPVASSVVSQRAPGTIGTPAAAMASRAAVLLPICAHGAGGRTDEDDAGPLARLGKRRVLAEEAVAGVDGVAAGLLRDVDDLVDAQVALGRPRRPDGVGLVGHPHVQRRAVDSE